VLPNILVGVSSGTNVGASTRTDGQGRYTLTGLRTGSMTLSASAVSYVTVDQPITLSSTRTLDFVLPRVPSGPGPGPTPTPPGGILGSGAFIEFSTNSTTCRCWDSTVSLRVNGQPVGTMSCGGSFTVSVAPGTYTIQECDSAGCLTQTSTVVLGQTGGVTIICTGASALGAGRGGSRTVDCAGGTAIKR
jgi:hypothetical protein